MENETSTTTEAGVSTNDLLEFYKLILPSHSPEDIGKALESEKALIGEDELARAILKYGSYTEKLIRMLDAHSDQTVFTKQALAMLKDLSMVGNAYEYIPEEASDTDATFILKNRILTNLKSRGGAEVSGKDARLLILAGNKNIKRTTLYNSGFYIVLRGPSLVEINLVYNQLNESLDSYGKIIGAIFYMHSDFKIKSIIWDFIESLVIDSNLKNWDNGTVLRENASFADYSTALLTVLTLMYKNGYPFTHLCLNPECKHEIEESVDLSMMQQTDFSRIPHPQMQFLAKGAKLDPGQLTEYKKELKLADTVTFSQYKIFRRVPSMNTYLRQGDLFNEEMRAAIQSTSDKEIVQQYINFNYVKIFEPWISYVEVYSEDGVLDYKIIEPASISLIMSQIQSSEDSEKFVESMQEYIKTACITLMGFAFDACPVCNQAPSNSVNGFVPFDPQSSFFLMAVRLLLEKSSQPSMG